MVHSRRRGRPFILLCASVQRSGSYCVLLESFCGKLSSCWIFCVSLLISSAWDLTCSSPINSSVNCRRDALTMSEERNV